MLLPQINNGPSHFGCNISETLTVLAKEIRKNERKEEKKRETKKLRKKIR